MIRLPDCTLAAALLLPAAVHAQTQLQVEELVHVGPPAAEFAALTDVALTSAGALWIDDGMAGEVHLWVNGLLRQVSGTGDGPGEVRTGALELVAVGGDTVMVVEPGRARISVFAPGGAFVRALALEQVQGLTSGWRHVGGRLYARVNRQTMVQPGAGAPEGGDPVVVYDLGGRRVRDAAELPQSGGVRMGAGGRPTIELLASEPVWDVDESGRVLVARTDAYEVRSEAPEGGGGVVVRKEATAVAGLAARDSAGARSIRSRCAAAHTCRRKRRGRARSSSRCSMCSGTAVRNGCARAPDR